MQPLADDEDDEDDHQPDSPSRGRGLHDLEESLLDDPTVTGSTPRPPATKSMRPDFADLGSPYEKLRRELQGSSKKGGRVNDNDTVRTDLFEEGDFDHHDGARGGYPDDEDTLDLPTQQRRAATKLPDMSMTPDKHSSSMLEEPTLQFGAPSTSKKNKDPLLHRVLDKNYRLQATPLTGANAYHRASPDKFESARRTGGGGRGRGLAAETPQGKKQAGKQLWDDSPQSSPEMAMPTLRSDLYSMSPVKTRGMLYGKKVAAAGGPSGSNNPPRTPGVSVQTPATGNKKTKDVFASDSKGKATQQQQRKKVKDEITWESDSDDYDFDGEGGGFGGMSPPKTIQFALPPSKLMQTPGV